MEQVPPISKFLYFCLVLWCCDFWMFEISKHRPGWLNGLYQFDGRYMYLITQKSWTPSFLSFCFFAIALYSSSKKAESLK